MLGKWPPARHRAVVPHLREQMRVEQPAQWETAGYPVIAADGSRVALARSKSLEAAFAPTRRRIRATPRKKAAGGRRAAKRQAAAARHKKATSPQLWLTLLWFMRYGSCKPRGSRRETLLG
jgi:hypothetical protein